MLKVTAIVSLILGILAIVAIYSLAYIDRTAPILTLLVYVAPVLLCLGFIFGIFLNGKKTLRIKPPAAEVGCLDGIPTAVESREDKRVGGGYHKIHLYFRVIAMDGTNIFN